MDSKILQIHQTTPDSLTKVILEGVDEKLKNFAKDFKPSEKEALMTVEETTKFLKCSKQALWNWNKSGVLNSRRLGNRVYYLKSEIFKSLIKQK